MPSIMFQSKCPLERNWTLVIPPKLKPQRPLKQSGNTASGTFSSCFQCFLRKDLHSEAVSWQNDGCSSQGIREHPGPFRLCLLWANGLSTSFWYSFVSFIPNGAIATTLTVAPLISCEHCHISDTIGKAKISFVLHDKGILEGQECRYKSPGSSLDALTSLTFQQQTQLKGQHQCLVRASGMPWSSVFSHYYFWL